MEFNEALSQYLEKLGVSQRKFAAHTGLSPATISRYCSGKRQPSQGSSHVRQIADGIASLSDMTNTEAEAVYDALNEALDTGIHVGYEVYLSNLKTLLDVLDVKISELARAIRYDPSHVSRILSGSRRPGSITRFTEDAAAYLAKKAVGSEGKQIYELLGTDNRQLRSEEKLKQQILNWLVSNPAADNSGYISRFLDKLDDFDLNEYMQAIHFDEMRLPPAIPRPASNKIYYGIRQMMTSELDFMKATVLSRSKEDCILYSDMPLNEMAEDPEFPKKWMFGMGMMLKKGLHLHIIHDVNRPFAEMMLGLEGNIPMYMTGQISPYYLPASQSIVFNHLLKVSGAAALEGIAISGHQGEGKYVLYRSGEDVRRLRKVAEGLLSMASPLMDIYRGDRKAEYLAKLDSYMSKYDCRIVCSSLPVYTMSESLLDRILSEAGTPDELRREIHEYHSKRRDVFFSHLENGKVSLEVPEAAREMFTTKPLNLHLSDIFPDTDVPYSFETYSDHLEEIRQLANAHPGLTLKTDPAPAFRNLSFAVYGDKGVIVSKENSPAIHFVIHHRQMVKAFSDFAPPIVEN